MDDLSEDLRIEVVSESGEDGGYALGGDGQGWVSSDGHLGIWGRESRLLFRLTGEHAIDSHGDG